MSDGIIVAIITSATSLLLALVNVIIAAVKARKEKKSGIETRIENIEKTGQDTREEVRELRKHNELQYMALLRLTVMDSDMPMSERLIAGKEYLSRDGNGDVKEFYKALEQSVNA